VKYRAYRKPSRKLRIAKVGKPRSFGGNHARHAAYIVACLLAIYEDFPKAIIAIEVAQLRVKEKIEARKARDGTASVGFRTRKQVKASTGLYSGVKEVLRIAKRELLDLMKGEGFVSETSAFFVASWRVIDDRRSLKKSNPVACNPKERTKAKREARDLKNVYESDTKRLTNMRAARGIPPLGL